MVVYYYKRCLIYRRRSKVKIIVIFFFIDSHRNYIFCTLKVVNRIFDEIETTEMDICVMTFLF